MYYNTIQVVSRSEKNGKMKRTAIYLTSVKLCIQLPPEKQNVKLLHLVDLKKNVKATERFNYFDIRHVNKVQPS